MTLIDKSKAVYISTSFRIGSFLKNLFHFWADTVMLKIPVSPFLRSSIS
jgi:hypothetical protein